MSSVELDAIGTLHDQHVGSDVDRAIRKIDELLGASFVMGDNGLEFKNLDTDDYYKAKEFPRTELEFGSRFHDEIIYIDDMVSEKFTANMLIQLVRQQTAETDESIIVEAAHQLFNQLDGDHPEDFLDDLGIENSIKGIDYFINEAKQAFQSSDDGMTL